MTELTPATPHLDDEALVALLDDEGTEAERDESQSHLDSCETCRVRHEELAGASAVVATPVDTLADDVKNQMVLRALLALTADEAPDVTDEPEAATLVPLRPRRQVRKGRGTHVAAAMVVIAGVAAGAWVASGHVGLVMGPNGSAASPDSRAGVHSDLTAPGATAVAAPLLELRPVVSGTSASCVSVAEPDPSKDVLLPDAIYSPADRQACLTLGPSVATLMAPAPAQISGPGGLAGPDTLTISFPAAASLELTALHVRSMKSGTGAGWTVTPDGRRLVAIADGAVVGSVASVTSGSDGSEVVVIDEISPGVAEYVESLLEPRDTVTGRQRVPSGSNWGDVVGYSRAVRVGAHVIVAGTTAVDPEGRVVGPGDWYEQTRYALGRVVAALAEVGAEARHVVRTRFFVTDITHWEEVGRAHAEVFGEARPACTMVEVVRLIDPALLVELEADAIVDDRGDSGPGA